MKWIGALEIALGVAKFTCCLMGAAAGVLRAESESLPYHLIRFEENEGYQAGAFKGTGGGLQLLQGDARIVRDDGDVAVQCLETVAGNPYPSIHFHGERVSRNHKTSAMLWFGLVCFRGPPRRFFQIPRLNQIFCQGRKWEARELAACADQGAISR